jgi:hypothetical protein
MVMSMAMDIVLFLSLSLREWFYRENGEGSARVARSVVRASRFNRFYSAELLRRF